MQESSFIRLKQTPRLSSFHYHAAGLLEAHARVEETLRKLDKTFGDDPEATADLLTELWVEIYHHVQYHMDELRRPLADLKDEMYEHLAEKSSREVPNAGK